VKSVIDRTQVRAVPRIFVKRTRRTSTGKKKEPGGIEKGAKGEKGK